jgi:hypothetical protein
MRRVLCLSAIMVLALSGPVTAQEEGEVIKETESVDEPAAAETGFPEGAATDNEGVDIEEGVVPEPPAAEAAGPDPAGPEVEAPPTWAHWYFMSELDAREGGVQHFAFVTERDDAYGRIYVQCTGGGRLYVFVTTRFLGLDDMRPPISYRINEERKVSVEGILSQDGRAVFFGKKRGAFLSALRRGKTMEIATRRQDGYPITLRFTLAGSSKAVGRVLRACDYDPKRDRTVVERDIEARAAEQAKLNAKINREFRRPKTGIQVETLY